MSYFTDESLRDLNQHINAIDSKYHELLLKFNAWPFANPMAQEHARHGFTRRMKTLSCCVHNVLHTVPPECESIPTDD